MNEDKSSEEDSQSLAESSKELGFREGVDNQYIVDEIKGRMIDPNKNYVSERLRKKF